MYLRVPIIIYCVFRVTMDSAHRDEAPQGTGNDLEPLRQEQAVDNSHETSTEGKKLMQYLAVIFGKNQGCSTSKFASLILLRELVCTITQIMSKVLISQNTTSIINVYFI
jgi:hypothetical protein